MLQSKKGADFDSITIENNDLKNKALESVGSKDIDSGSLNSKNVDVENDDIENIDIDDNDEEQAIHELHHQLTTLLYISEFATPFLDKKKSKNKAKRWLKRVVKAQTALNQYRNHLTYQQRYQLKSETDINALYGAGWFAAMLAIDYKHTEKYLAKVTDSSIF